MKFIRNTKTREKLVDFVTKGVLIALSALVCLWMVSGARAQTGGTAGITGIKQESLPGGGLAVEFLLSQPVSKGDVAVDFQRNFIQLSLKGVTAYPARTQKIEHSILEKVFTYQYQPDTARARLLLKGTAKDIQAQSRWEINERSVRIIVSAGSDRLASVSAGLGAKKEAELDAQEAAAREELLGSGSASREAKASVKSEGKADAKAGAPADLESTPLFGGSATSATVSAPVAKEIPTTKIFASLLLVVGVIGAVAAGFRKFALGKGNPFQRQPKLIEVVSTQGLGPKRSIAVVKVMDQYMVVGMSGDGMSLLANLGANASLDKYVDSAGPGGSFNDVFDGLVKDDRSAPTAGVAPAAAPRANRDLGVRASIKKRLEGFKPL